MKESDYTTCMNGEGTPCLSHFYFVKRQFRTTIKFISLFLLIYIVILGFSPHLKQKSYQAISQVLKIGESFDERIDKCGMISTVNTPTKNGRQYIGIHIDSPRPYRNDIVEGETIKIQNTNSNLDGEYKVLGTWIDQDGKIGAVDIDHDYNISIYPHMRNMMDDRFSGIKNSFCYSSKAIKVIKENIFFGAGLGDSKMELQKKRFGDVETKRLHNGKFNYHNQYLESIAAIGIFGASILLLIFIVSFIRSVKTSNFLFFAFLFIVVISCLTESILQRQLGVAFFVFFCSVFGINTSNRDKRV